MIIRTNYKKAKVTAEVENGEVTDIKSVKIPIDGVASDFTQLVKMNSLLMTDIKQSILQELRKRKRVQ